MESRSLKLKRLLVIDSSDLLYNYISKSEIIFTSIKKKKVVDPISRLVAIFEIAITISVNEVVENNVTFEEKSMIDKKKLARNINLVYSRLQAIYIS